MNLLIPELNAELQAVAPLLVHPLVRRAPAAITISIFRLINLSDLIHRAVDLVHYF